MKENSYEEIINKYELQPFTLNVLSIKRTVIDKLVSLVRMSYKKDLSEFHGKTRHLYDLHMTYNFLRNFYCDSIDLSKIVNIVRRDEENSRFKDEYPYKERWSSSPLFNVIDSSSVKDTYENKFGKEFVYGDLPSYSQIINTMQLIKRHLIAINE